MKRECPQCGFELREMSWSEKFALEKLTRFEFDVPTGRNVTHMVGFDVWLEVKVGHVYEVPGLNQVTLVDAQIDYDFEESESMVYLVLKTAVGDHFKITGYRDSYGNANWDLDQFREVSQQTRTTWVWQESY